MDDSEIKLGFLEEGQQLIEELETLLLTLEGNPQNQETMDGIFRIIHNIKGSARAVGFEHLGVYCHELETYLLKYKNGAEKITSPVVNKFLYSRDIIAQALTAYRSDLNAAVDFSEGLNCLKAEDSDVQEIDDSPADSAPAGGLVIQNKKPVAAGDTSVRVNLARVDKLINAVGELVVLDSVLKQQVSRTMSLEMTKVADQIGKIIREVQDLSMSLRLVPVKPLIQKLQRISRDTAAAVEKNVNFQINGEDNEIDKTILDMISDPLVHLVRNGIDHGLETKEERQALGKSSQGSLILSISHEGGKLVIRLKDDGKGLDPVKIGAKAVEKGLIASTENLTTQKIYELIFEPGFSTKAAVTEVSGRGVGMDVVRTSIESLGGHIDIQSEVNKGTEFTLTLPLTVAIIEGMVVKSKNDRFIVPFSQVSETVKITDADLKQGNESGTLLPLRGSYYPLYKMSDLLGIKKDGAAEGHNGIGIITRAGRFNFVVLVDDVLGQQQIVVKQLGAELSGYKRFVGSSVLGDGKPALILDLVQLAEDQISKQRMHA